MLLFVRAFVCAFVRPPRAGFEVRAALLVLYCDVLSVFVPPQIQ